MPFNKEYFLQQIGEERMNKLAEMEIKSLKEGFEEWLIENQPQPKEQQTMKYWLENEVALDYGFIYGRDEYADLMYDDYLYRQMGSTYEWLKISYDQYIHRLEQRFPNRMFPDTLAKMLNYEVWKILAKTLDFNLYNVL